MAKKDGKTLPVKFWNNPTWAKVYKIQLLKANSLLKLYSVNAIIAALKRVPKAYSLHGKWLDIYFEEEQRKIDNAKEKQEIETEEAEEVKEEIKEVVAETRPQFIEKKNIINKLKDL